MNSGPKSSVSKIWRISISASPCNGLGQRLTHSMASSFDLTCRIQKPAISSLVPASVFDCASYWPGWPRRVPSGLGKKRKSLPGGVSAAAVPVRAMLKLPPSSPSGEGLASG